MMKVRCDDRSGCVAEADAVEFIETFDPNVKSVHLNVPPMNIGWFGPPKAWTSNNGLGGNWKHYCPIHPQPEIGGG